MFQLKHHVVRFLLLLASVCAITGTAVADDWIYSVVDGDNLWDFSEKYLDTPLRFEKLRRLNNVQFPKRMKPGTRLRVPMAWIRSNPVPAKISAVEGQVEIIRAEGGGTQAASAGALLKLGDAVKTGADSSVAITFADGTLLTLYSNGEMRFNHLSAHGETGMVDSRLHLIDGRLDTKVTPAVGPGSRFEIETPSAISAVRGTVYRAAVTDEGNVSNVEVLEGKVQVTGANKHRLVPSGFGTQVAMGKPPIKPRKLLTAPVFETIPEPIRQLRWTLGWRALPGAKAYRIEISKLADFSLLIWEQKSQYAKTALPDLPDGVYHIRVRGIDDLGLEGKDAVARIMLDAHPQPPVALNPPDARVLRGKPAELQWTDSEEADRYVLEVAADDAFSNLLVHKQDLDSTRYTVDEITEAGVYYWRLTSIAADGEVGPPGPSRSWELKPIPQTIEPALEADEDALTASWNDAGPGRRYHVQLAYDRGFREMEIDSVTEEPKIVFEQLGGQVRYLRVRVIEPDGYQGPWGTVQRVDPAPDPTAWVIPILGALGLILL